MAVVSEIVFIFVLILANGFLAMAEIALVSARRARLLARAENGDAGAQAALVLAEEPDRFLSTVQIGITLIATLTGVVGGATLAETLADGLRRIPALLPYADSISLFLIVLAITYFSLVFGELAPKRIGLGQAEQVSALVARPMTILSKVTTPLVTLLTRSTDFVVRLLRIKPSDEAAITEAEIIMLIEEGQQEGVFEAGEQELVENIFRFADRRVSALITPHTELDWLDIEDSLEENSRRIAESHHQCFPVARRSLDNVMGIACVKDLWQQLLDGQPLDLTAVLVEPLYVPESAPALNVLSQFRKSEFDIALVLDEYGGVMGMLTLTDLLEGLIGDIPSADVDGEAAIVRREDGTWLLDGLLPIDEFEHFFGVDTLPSGEQDFQTVGGFVMSKLGRIPVETDKLTWEGLVIEVLDMDALRVDKVLVRTVEPGPDDYEKQDEE